ncbi:hypothetical protein LTR85_004998 [Meristemomyces frigidus]|nr:hypothetical protein LTR85_004998 [Meristemomyces frigidus]
MPSSPTVRDLKASFEARDTAKAISSPPPLPSLRVVLPANANMFPKKFSNPLKTSIDTVLDTAKSTLQKPNVTVTAAAPAPAPPPDTTPPPTTLTSDPPTPPTPSITPATPTVLTAAPTPVRPSALQRPSWIGPPRPDRPVTPGINIMKQPVTVEYASPGLQPPVYVFTSLSDPQWDAVEMDAQKKDDGEYHFTKSFAAEEGEYQYKFRLGPGDWWALNENAPIVDDGAGNKNNLMVVKPDAPVQASQPPASTPAEQTRPAANPAVEAVKAAETPRVERPPAIEMPTGMAQPEAVATPAPAPLMQHEALAQPDTAQRPQSIKMPPVTLLNQALPTPGAVTPAPAPLMKHETFFPPPVDVKDETDVEPDYAYNGNDEDQDDEDGEDDGPPLLRHESFAPDSVEQTQAPLLRHESMAIGEHLDDDTGRLSPQISSSGSVYSSGEDSVAPEADPNDPSLERFPTDQNGIFEHIRRASTQLPEDEVREVADIMSHIRSHSNPPTSPLISLPSVQEDDEEELDELGDYEREKAQKEAQGSDEVDPMAPAVTVTESDQAYEAPITPPMTPQEVEKTIERVLEEDPVAAGAAETIIERVVEAEQAEAGAEARNNDETQGEKVVAEYVQERGAAGTFADFLKSPMAWLAFAGIAVAVIGGVWKLR